METATHALADVPRGEIELETELAYARDRPVRVLVRRRGHRYDLDDRGRAVSLAGRPPGWLRVAEAVVTREGLNVNRRGVVFVPAVLGRDIDALAGKVATTSLAVYDALLELDA